MGFVAADVIFLLLAAAVYFFMQPVNSGAQNLRNHVLPLLQGASNIQYGVAREAAEVRNYLLRKTDEVWEQVNFFHAEAVQAFAEFQGVFDSPGSEKIRTPEIENLFSGLNADYNVYKTMVGNVKGQQETMKSGLATVLSTQSSLVTEIGVFIFSEIEIQAEEIQAGANPVTVRRRSNRIDALRGIQEKSYQATFEVAQGLNLGSEADFKKALELTEAMITVIEDFQAPDYKSAQAKEMGYKLRLNLDKFKADVVSLISQYNQAAGETSMRTDLLNKITTEAEKLRDMGNALAMEVAVTSAEAASRVIFILLVGTLTAIVIGLIMAFTITRGITRPINRIVETLSEGAQEVDNASRQLSSSSAILADGATENAASLEQTSAALEQLSSMTRRNSDNAVEANALMAQATQAVNKADSSMTNVITAMDEISTSGSEIGKIIKTIDEIAFQTNLLALNAAVEAARAGVAGAGFAVVADEVRNLAIRSADAAKSTADLIASTISNIQSGSEMVNTTAENFKTVAVHSCKVAELLGEVAEASKEQSQGIGQITTAMNQMDKVTQSNAASAQESASASSQLSRQADNLLAVVGDITTLVHGGGPEMANLSQGRAPHRPRAVSHQPVRQLPMGLTNDDF